MCFINKVSRNTKLYLEQNKELDFDTQNCRSEEENRRESVRRRLRARGDVSNGDFDGDGDGDDG